MITSYEIKTAFEGVQDGLTDVPLVDTPGVGRKIVLMRATLNVFVAATLPSGKVALSSGVGGTRFFEVSADAAGNYKIDFGEEGYALPENTILNFITDGSADAQASAQCAAIYRITGV